jgi:hypothetical protein
VLRFWNNDVLGNIEGVLEVIADAIAANGSKERIQARDSSSSPSPLAGEGRGGGSSDCVSAVPYLPTPTPDPSPQGGGEQKAALVRGAVVRDVTTESASSPSPLAGEGWGGGSSDCVSAVPHLTTPTPDPSPQGGGEQKAALVRRAAVRNVTNERASSPSPLAGEGRGGGSSDCVSAVPYLTTPAPAPSPQGGGEQKAELSPRLPISRARE